MICWDIESGPLPWGKLQNVIPKFDEEKAIPDPGEFDPASVKHGNTKDAEKRAAKESEARLLHEQTREQLPQLRAAARNEHNQKFIDAAALRAHTGMVKAVGVLVPDSGPLIVHACPHEIDRTDLGGMTVVAYSDEAEIIVWFWDYFTRCHAEDKFVGHNIYGFDLPFLVQRSWLLDVDVPACVMPNKGQYRPWNRQFVDTMEEWACGKRGDMIGLGDLDRAMGGQGKPDDCTGADFARLLDNGGADAVTAIRYLANDLAMQERVTDGLGIL